jgi:hypothetical protein
MPRTPKAPPIVTTDTRGAYVRATYTTTLERVCVRLPWDYSASASAMHQTAAERIAEMIGRTVDTARREETRAGYRFPLT